MEPNKNATKSKSKKPIKPQLMAPMIATVSAVASSALLLMVASVLPLAAVANCLQSLNKNTSRFLVWLFTLKSKQPIFENQDSSAAEAGMESAEDLKKTGIFAEKQKMQISLLFLRFFKRNFSWISECFT